MVLASMLLAVVALAWMLAFELALWWTFDLICDAFHALWRKGWRGWRRRKVWLLALLLAAPGCATLDTGARTALNALADVVDPAWQLAEQACLARQQVPIAREKAGLLKPDETNAQLASIRANCDVVTSRFASIRALHEQGKQLVESGDVAKAGAILDDIRAKWREIGETP